MRAFQFPPNGKVLGKTRQNHSRQGRPQNEPFQFPPNGKVLGKNNSSFRKTHLSNRVSIPSKRESAWQAKLCTQARRKADWVSIPSKRESAWQEDTHIVVSSHGDFVSIPSKRESAWQDEKGRMTRIAADQSFNSLQTGKGLARHG